MDDVLLPHNIDVMHTEKNIGEALFGTIMDIPDKTKDNVNARVDQAMLCNRPKLDMKPPIGGKSELRQAADGFAYRVRSFGAYDVNGYCFHTTRHEQSRPNRRITNSGVFTQDLNGLEYYGRIEEIYELNFYGCKPLNP